MIADFGLIKQKLGEMAVRCYVGDAMVYRTLGDVDQALEAVAETESERVLKTIEGFAVECSINKVWTSETLACSNAATLRQERERLRSTLEYAAQLAQWRRERGSGRDA